MTLEDLISEGRRLLRPTVLLKPNSDGEVAARWYEYDANEANQTDHRCWLTVNSPSIPGTPNGLSNYITIFTNEKDRQTGYVDSTECWPDRVGTNLFAEMVDILPPIDAIIARGSTAVDEWLAENKWRRDRRYNDNFADRVLVEKYERLWFDAFPAFRVDGTFAAIGGWHLPGPDHDWHDLIDQKLCVMTVYQSEPLVEAWRMNDGRFQVIQRIT